MRSLRNANLFTAKEERNRILEELMNFLRINGYSRKFRVELLKGVLTRKEQMEAGIRNKGVPRFRNREEIMSTKRKR